MSPAGVCLGDFLSAPAQLVILRGRQLENVLHYAVRQPPKRCVAVCHLAEVDKTLGYRARFVSSFGSRVQERVIRPD